MLKFLTYILALTAVVTILPAWSNGSEVDSLLQQAATAYQSADYDRAVKYYDESITRGVNDPRIYYNLGNAYFKTGQLGESILCYERAILLDPSDPQIQHNLNVAKARIRDRIDPIPLLFLVQWWNDVKDAHSVDTLFVWSVVILWVFAVTVFLFFGFKNVVVRRGALATGVIVFAFLLSSIVLVQDKMEDLSAHRYGIVLSVEASVSSVPDKSGVDAFFVHEGLKVEIIAENDTMMKIRLVDGKEGWIEKDNLRRI